MNYDQNSYWGRARHFFETTDPRLAFRSSESLLRAKEVVEKRKKEMKEGNNLDELNDEEYLKAKRLYDSAFHPQTGEKMFLAGRMCFQVPGNMMITGCMMAFYRSIPAVIFWQIVNQSFNALVNYTNRNASADSIDDVKNKRTITRSFLLATITATGVGVSLTRLTKSQGLLARLVPFAAVAAANCVNIPAMRAEEIKEGIDLNLSKTCEPETVVGKSRIAARRALSMVIPSRIGMAAPPMFLVPFVCNTLFSSPSQFPLLQPVSTVLLTGACLAVSTPLCCALFPQTSKISRNKVEPEIQVQVPRAISHLYFNKGL